MALSERDQYLVAVVGADITQFRKGMRDVRHELGVLDADTSSVLGKVGRTLTYTLTTPLLAAGGVMVSQASNFEAAMRNVNSIALLTEQEFSTLSQSVLDFGMNTRGGATSAANALYTIYSAGVSGSLAMDLMRVSVTTAEAGLADMAVTAEALTSAMLSFGFKTEEEAWRASNALTRMVQVGVGSMENFAGSIATFMPAASSLGVTIEEAFALNARLTQLGYSASEAAVRVNASMRSMIKPSEAMLAAFNELGVKSTKELIDKFGGLTEALIALRGTTNGTEEELAALFSDTRALQGVLMFTKNVDETRATLAAFMTDLDSATMDSWSQQTQSFAYAMDKAKSAVQGLAIKVGMELIPIINPLVDGFINIVNKLAETDDNTLRLVAVMGALAAAFPPILWGISSLMSPFGVIVGTIAAVKHAFDTNFLGITTVVQNTVAEVERVLAPLKTTLDSFLNDIFGDSGLSGLTGNMGTVGTLTASVPVEVETYTVETGDSLWQIWYDDYKERYGTFEEFLLAAGITDASLTIHPRDVITFTTTGENVVATAAEEYIVDGWQFGMESALEQTPTDFWSRAGASLARHKDDFLAQFQSTIDSFIPVFDTGGGNLLNALASGFSTATSSGNGNTMVYNAIRDLFDYVFGGGVGEDLQNQLPGITSGLNNLLNSMGQWIMQEGVPTLARAVGFLVGRIGTIIGSAVGSLWQSITDPNAASNAMSSLGESVTQPFSQGLAEGLGDGGVSDPVEAFFSTLAGAFATYVLGGQFLSLITGKKGFITAIKDAILQGLRGIVWVVDFVGTGLIHAIEASITRYAGTAFTFAGLGNTIVGKVTSALGYLATLALPITMGIALGVAVSSLLFEPITEFWDRIGATQAAERWAQDLKMRYLDAIGAQGGYFDVSVQARLMVEDYATELGLSSDNITVAINDDNFYENTMSYVETAIREALNIGDTAAIVDMETILLDYLNASTTSWTPSVDVTLSPEQIAIARLEFDTIQAVLEEELGRQLPEFEQVFNVTLVPSFSTTPPTDTNVPTEEGIKAKYADMFNLTNIDLSVVPTLNEVGGIADTGVMTEAARADADHFVLSLGGAVSESLNANGVVSEEAVTAAVTTPVYNALNSGFGEGGTVRTLWAEWVTAFSTGVDTINADVAGLGTDIPPMLQTLHDAIKPILDNVALEFMELTIAVDAAVRALNGANGLNVSIGVTRVDTESDGSHRAGLSYVPFDGYMAELHRGERVLTKAENREYSGVPRGIITPKAEGGKSVQNNQTNNITISGVVTPQQIIREFEKRGIYLDRRKT